MAKLKSPKRRSRELSTKKLIKAGLEVFSKHGFEAATTRMIAKRAGMNEALIARYFKNKVGLLNAIILQFAEHVQERVSNYPAGETLEQEIINFMEAHLELFMEHRDFTRIGISRSLTDPKLNKELQKYFFLEADGLLVRRLRAFQEKGIIAADRDILMAATIIQLEAKGIFFMNSIIDGFCDQFDDSHCDQMAFNLAYGLQTPMKKKKAAVTT